jgi:beta-N-acetylhexosaminidase
MSASASSFAFHESMSLRQKIGQLIFVRVGSNLPPVKTVEQDEERALRLLEECPVGGLLLFNGGPNAKESLARLQAVSEVPLLVGSDIERGVGQQVKGYTLFPHAMALGKGKATIGLFMEALVREARDVGIHIVFGPVADINTNPLNPIISIRAFSEEVDQAAELVADYVRMAEETDLLTTAKHFPGHGDTFQDSHDSLPSLDISLDELCERELIPFQAAINAGCSLVMTAHIAFPRIDPSCLPATLSRIILVDLLRGEMGFEGAVCSDSLLMAGVREQFATEGELALAALNAGVDVLLDFEDPIAVLEHLLQAHGTGALDEARVDQALQRVLALKRKTFGRPPVPLPLPKNIPATASVSELFEQAAQQAARNAVEVVDFKRAILPLDAEAATAVVLLKPFETAIEPPEQPLGAAARDCFRDVNYVQLGPRAGEAAYQSAWEAGLAAKQVVLAMIVRPAAWHAYGLRPEQVKFVRRLTAERSGVVLAALGAPYPLNDFPDAAVRICTYSDVSVSQQALAEFLVAGK